jgi:hypothetical protein
MNVVGLGSEELYEIARVLEEILREKELIGFDVCGVETFLLGREFPNGSTDRTLERLSDFVRILLGREARDADCPPGEGRRRETHNRSHSRESGRSQALEAPGFPLSRE